MRGETSSSAVVCRPKKAAYEPVELRFPLLMENLMEKETSLRRAPSPCNL
jgi:hypothetical protein